MMQSIESLRKYPQDIRVNWTLLKQYFIVIVLFIDYDFVNMFSISMNNFEKTHHFVLHPNLKKNILQQWWIQWIVIVIEMAKIELWTAETGSIVYSQKFKWITHFKITIFHLKNDKKLYEKSTSVWRQHHKLVCGWIYF